MTNFAQTLPDYVLQKVARLGDAGRRWLDGLDDLVAELAAEWDLRVGETLAGGTEAYVAAAQTSAGAPVVLKVAIPAHADNLGLAHEIAAFTVAAGRGYARLIQSDLPRRALLLERLGAPLRALGYAPTKQMDLICATLRLAWRPLPQRVALPTGAKAAEWFARFIADLAGRLDQPCSQRALQRATAYAEARARAFDPARAVLVHGDAHNNNTLQDPAQPTAAFKLIDPDGLAAEPAYDLGVLMREWLDELTPDPMRLSRERCAYLSHLTGQNQHAIWEWGYLQCMATGLILLQVGQEPAGRLMLMVAEAWAGA